MQADTLVQRTAGRHELQPLQLGHEGQAAAVGQPTQQLSVGTFGSSNTSLPCAAELKHKNPTDSWISVMFSERTWSHVLHEPRTRGQEHDNNVRCGWAFIRMFYQSLATNEVLPA
eukprot:1144271-Pelagomonas_calceolata.AAC.3